ncbi:MAG: hypothetical protein ABI222_16510 [Opitutaceae bacterium]
MSDTRNPLLLQAAGELASEIRDGKWQHIAELETQPAQGCDEIIAELRSRCSGFTRAEYETAIADGLRAPSLRVHRGLSSTCIYWMIACTFIWAFFISTVGLKKVSGLNEWFAFFLYPAMCGAAAFYVLRSKRNGRVGVALLNVAFGIAWMIFVMWAARAFARGFWK